MVTGIETAGLVLGAFPLLLQGFEVYLEGSKKVADLWHWRNQLYTIIEELNFEYHMFELTCKRIFEELGDTELMDGTVKIWKTSDFEARIIDHMGKPVEICFLGQVKRFVEFLDIARNELGLDHIALKDLEEPEDAAKRQALDKAKVKIIQSILSNRDMLENIKKVNNRLERFEHVTSQRRQAVVVPTEKETAGTEKHKTMCWCEMKFEPTDNPEPESARISDAFSNFETAGLVLGAFPLLLQGFEVYLDGSKKVAGLWNWRRQLRTIIREFIVECALFTMACERIFEELDDTESIGGISSLMDGRVEIWRSPDLQARLTHHMGENTARAFLNEVEQLHIILEDVRKRLKLNDITPKDLEPSHGSAKHPALKNVRLDVMDSVFSNSDVVGNIKKINDMIEKFVLFSSRRSQPIKASKEKTAAVKHYKCVRDNAFDLYTVLEEKFAPCKCTILSHTGYLPLLEVVAHEPQLKFTVLFTYNTTKTISWCRVELEPVDNPEPETARVSDELSTPSKQPDSSSKPKNKSVGPSSRTQKLEKHNGRDSTEVEKIFGVMLDRMQAMVIPSKFRPKGFRLTPPETPQSRIAGDLQEIDNLCQAIQEASTNSGVGRGCELGILDSPKSKCKYRICSLRSRLSSTYLSEVISLGELLEDGMFGDQNDRLEMSVILATAAMQLYGTVWLKDCWGKDDIFFLQTIRTALGDDQKPIQIREPVLGKPLVRCFFEPTFSSRRSSPPPTRTHDRFLRSLGIILVELLYGKPITEICPNKPGVEDISKITVSSADDLIDRITCDAGQLYACAVENCIKGIDHDVRNLDNDEFRGKVDTAVVMNLKRHYDAFREGKEWMK
ncbi:hypothetical protein BZA77DRAFT_127525 [Pyronema omphalodes]|nr:hypothetical protein BZA77DRAFT_127525 [Pyronema omphalodes]